jgi:hypothetical protein
MRSADISGMATAYLAARREFLRASQNADGGWGYFPCRESWLEPTAYAMLALHGDAACDDRVGRAWRLVRSWQSADGGWRPSGTIPDSTWSTALAVTLCTVHGESGSAFERGVDWLLASAGAESSMVRRIFRAVGLGAAERDISLKGWPWRTGTSAWVEPTAHTLVALKKAWAARGSSELSRRVDMGERMLLDIRCPDGGWNYGSPRALGIDLPSYPETTALALLGLQGRVSVDELDRARAGTAESPSRLARAWLNVAAGIFGVPSETADEPIGPDVLLAAVEALGAPDGNYALLKTEAA